MDKQHIAKMRQFDYSTHLIKHRQTVKQCVEKFFDDGNPLKASLIIEWNNRLKRRVAQIKCDVHNIYTISLSSHIWPHLTDSQRTEAVIHETCHMLAKEIYGGRMLHDWRWDEVMFKMGLRPNVHMDVDVVKLGISKPRPKITAVCGCAGGCKVGKIVMKRIKQGIKYKCLKCGGILRDTNGK